MFDLLDPDSFDLALFDHARTYPSRAEALAALSGACLRLAGQESPGKFRRSGWPMVYYF
ncbi:hypothetical protein FRUB_08647 [Fimbriiglobus ruber]|uniref:Uncharacterized protein n=1 Tax=Fimbriiglobus ruber TaxID=1908690 RepID=A0A225D8W1_9BACT|nr:hypothetical protein FRUB_08647 [Fimbriiglobus ruber]